MITRAVCQVLVGREDELSALEDALLQACRGEGSVVVLAGDAGMGKSRLCAELAERAVKIGAAVMEGSCSEAELALPYLPFLEAIGNHLVTARVEELRERLGAHSRELAKVFPQLGTIGSTSDGERSPDARLRLFEAMLALLGIAAEEHGLLLVVEDLHWADASTREFLDYLTRRLRNLRVLVLATYRRDEMHRKHPLLPTVQGWQRSRLARVIELEPLPAEGVARMVSAIFDNTTVGAEFRDFLHSRSEGNPFVLEEMLKAAIDRGDVYRVDEDWQRKPIAELRIPETVRDTILMRVERLDDRQSEILRCAAVLGRSFDYQTLIAVSEQDRSAVEGALQTAVQQQLLEEEVGTRGRYRFRHALTQEAIYEDLSAPTRERLHSAASDVLSAVPHERVAEVAFHLRAANRWEEAVAATLEAAAAAEDRFGFEEAVSLYSMLLPVLTTPAKRGELLCCLGKATWQAGRSAKAIEPLEEGIRLLEAAGRTLEAAPQRLVMGRCYWENSDTTRARAEYEAARAALEPAGPSRELAHAYIRLAGLHVFESEGPEGQRLSEKARDIAIAAGAEDMRVWSLNFLGMSLAWQGDYETGRVLLEQSAEEALAKGWHDIGANALYNLITIYLGGLQPRRIFALSERMAGLGHDRWRMYGSLFARIVWAHQTGNLRLGLEASTELRDRALEGGVGSRVRIGNLGIALCLVELDRIEEARNHLDRLDPTEPAQDFANSAWPWLRIHLTTGEVDKAAEVAEMFLLNPRFVISHEEAAEHAVEALLASDRRADAEVLLSALTTEASPAGRLAQALARSRLALHDGGAEAAVEPARAVADGFDGGDMVLRGCRARLFLARVLREAGRPEDAVAELERVLANAREHELPLLARLAREGLAALGVESEPLEQVSPVVTSPDQIGERLVTVMFADVRGYTAMTSERTPADMLDKISAYQRWAAHEIERQMGVVDKFAGDAVMATFNVSGTTVDHANHALQAALGLRDKAAMLGLPIGIGIATGAAVVGRLNSGANLSVLGQTTNLAARLQAQARAGEILLSEETAHRLQAGGMGEPESLALKGFEKPVTAYRLVAQRVR